MDDKDFAELFQSVVDRYELDPVTAEQLLQKILAILEKDRKESLQREEKYEILMEEIERGEL